MKLRGSVLLNTQSQQDEHMKVSELLSEGEIGTLTISQEGDKLIVKCTQRSGILARFGVARLARNIVKGKVRAFKMNFDKRTEVEDVRRLGEVSKLAFTGITKEKLQAEVDKVIEHFRKEEAAEEAYKAKAPERKAAKAKYDAQKRKDELAKYDELYGKGTWGRVTYMQRGGDDGYSYVVRVDGKTLYNGLTQSQAIRQKKIEVQNLAKREKLGTYGQK